MDVEGSGLAKVDTITMQVQLLENTTRISSVKYPMMSSMQVQFLFAVLWGLCSTVPEQSRKAFDAFFRNLVDGLVKGSAKPPSFKLGRSNLFGEQGTVFEYMINPEAAGTWCRWEEQIALVTVS